MLTGRGLCVLLLFCGPASSVAGDEAVFRGVGDLPGGSDYSLARAVSADGVFVVGESGSSLAVTQLFRWRSGVLEGLDTVGPDHFSRGNSISLDGTVICGTTGNVNADNSEAFVWNDGELTLLGPWDGWPNEGEAFDLTPDGSHVLGHTRNLDWDIEAFRWEDGDLNGIFPGVSFGTARGVSDDGSVIVGWGFNGSPQSEALRWQDGLVTPLSDLPGGDLLSRAMTVSADGSVIVGSGRSDAGTEAVRWTTPLDPQSLGSAEAGFTFSNALAVNADGSVIVGQAQVSPGPSVAFIWDGIRGFRILQDVLTEDHGLDLSGWELRSARGISSDGRVIVGQATNPQGWTEGWVAELYEARPGLVVERDGLSWTLAGQGPGTRFDIVSGDLTALRSAGGDFGQIEVLCLKNDQQSNSLPFTDDPDGGQAFWFAVRQVTAEGNGTYDAPPGSQAGSRDIGIDAAGGCP